MRGSVCRLFCMAMALLWLMVLVIVPAQGELLLELSAPKRQYVVNEPIFVLVAFRNAGVSDATILRYFKPGAGLLSFEIAAPGESSHQYEPWVRGSLSRECLAKGAVLVGPGESYTGVVDLTFDGGLGQSTLSRSGEYAISAKYHIRDDLPYGPVSLASNEIRINVAEPAGIDRDAFDILLEGSQAVELGFWNASTEQSEFYQRLLRDCSGSQYAVYAKFHLAQVNEVDAFPSKSPCTAEERRAYLSEAVALFTSVSDEAGDTPLGVYAKRLAARCWGKLGNVDEAQRLFEEALAMPSATDEDRLTVLCWMAHLDTGYFQQSCGLFSKSTPTDVELPLHRFAKTLGFSVEWDSASKEVRVAGSRVQSTFKPGTDVITVNGVERTGVRTLIRDGHTYVSLSVMAALMAEQYGEGLEAALGSLLAKESRTSDTD